MILVDTSVWIDHFRRGSARLSALLADQQVCCHPFVIGELALGHLRRRAEILARLADLPAAPDADHEEVLSFVDAHGLAGSGIGWIDAHLLASAAIGDLAVWTTDKHLHAAARRIGLALEP